MSTLVNTVRRPKTAAADDPAGLTEAAVYHYTAEEIVEKGLLPCTARWLKREAHARRIPFTAPAGKLRWRLDQILAISRQFDSAPILGRRAA